MEKPFAILGIMLCVGVAYCFSNKKKEINWASVGFLLIKTPLWKVVQMI